MSQPEQTSNKVDNRKQGRRGKPKGRVIDLNALLEVQALLGDEPRDRDLLIEHLHKIQDKFRHLSAAHIAALAQEMSLDQVTEAQKRADSFKPASMSTKK